LKATKENKFIKVEIRLKGKTKNDCTLLDNMHFKYKHFVCPFESKKCVKIKGITFQHSKQKEFETKMFEKQGIKKQKSGNKNEDNGFVSESDQLEK